MIDTQGICRVCRYESTPWKTLHHPCRCSERFIHTNCHSEKLSHNRKKQCELCGYSIAFPPIYQQDMTPPVSLYMLFGQSLSRCGSIIKTGFLALTVSSVWLVLVPFMAVCIWCFPFWSSKHIVVGVQGDKDLLPSGMAFPTRCDFNLLEFLIVCFGVLLIALVVVVVMSTCLFREWDIQNKPLNADQQDNDGNLIGSGDHTNQQHSNIQYNSKNIHLISTPDGQQHAGETMNNKSDDEIEDGGDKQSVQEISIMNKWDKLRQDIQQDLNLGCHQHGIQKHRPTITTCTMNSIDNETKGDSIDWISNDDEDEAQIESTMQSIMVQDPADALKRYSWDDLLNGNR
ncbi:hypothetical protein BC941DRAFT_499320 [Chlamydoabsidia padenii]|nr:hypothetical protein BC941DRAFT_499320 [Chlamydoabsidia padenii]